MIKKLENTEKTLRDLSGRGFIKSYILLVGYEGNEWQINSPDVNADTYFDAASLGKILPTTPLALMAIDRGLLSLDDTLEKFFDNVPDDKKNITVKQLLTHTSGIIRKEYTDGVADRGRESIAEFIFSHPLAFAPDTNIAYSCSGMVLLGFIMEKVYGMPLDKCLDEHICKVLGLTRSKYNVALDEPNSVVCHYDPTVNDCRLYDNNVCKMDGIPSGAGEDFVTARDLKVYAEALIKRDNRLYGREMFDLSERNHTENLCVLESEKCRAVENRALGFVYVDENCVQARELFPKGSIGHTGWTGQSLYLYREKGLYTILLTDSMRCVNRNYGVCDSERVHEMRTEVHRAIAKDLGIRN